MNNEQRTERICEMLQNLTIQLNPKHLIDGMKPSSVPEDTEVIRLTFPVLQDCRQHFSRSKNHVWILVSNRGIRIRMHLAKEDLIAPLICPRLKDWQNMSFHEKVSQLMAAQIQMVDIVEWSMVVRQRDSNGAMHYHLQQTLMPHSKDMAANILFHLERLDDDFKAVCGIFK
jgi:hypothetical protein